MSTEEVNGLKVKLLLLQNVEGLQLVLVLLLVVDQSAIALIQGMNLINYHLSYGN